MKYINILKSDFYRETYKKIEELKKDYPVNHGFVHIEHVIEQAKNLANVFSLSKKERENLLIACALHDVGYLEGRENHAKTGAEIAKKFLKENNFSDEDIKIICNAISRHGGKEISDFQDPISRCLILADKLDFVESRYDPLNPSVQNFRAIKKVRLHVNDGTLRIFVEDFFDVQSFESSNFERKLKPTLQKLSEVMNMSFTINYIQVAQDNNKSY